MDNSTFDTLTIELPVSAARHLQTQLDAQSRSVEVFESRRLSGLEDLATVVVPIAVGTVQVVSAFVIAWLQSRKNSENANTSSIRILVNDTAIEATNLTPDHVERIIGRALRVPVSETSPDR